MISKVSLKNTNLMENFGINQYVLIHHHNRIKEENRIVSRCLNNIDKIQKPICDLSSQQSKHRWKLPLSRKGHSENHAFTILPKSEILNISLLRLGASQDSSSYCQNSKLLEVPAVPRRQEKENV